MLVDVQIVEGDRLKGLDFAESFEEFVGDFQFFEFQVCQVV